MKKPLTLWIITCIILVINALFYIIKPGGEVVLLYVSDFLPVLCSIITILCLISAVRSFKGYDYTKLAWILILVGIIFYFFGESIYAFLEICMGSDMNENYPSFADYLWCFGYIPLLIGLLMIFIGYKKSGLPMGNTRLYFAIALLISLIVALVAYFLLIPVLIDPETETIDKVFYMFYPIGDLLIVIPAVILIYITSLFGSAAITLPWKYLTTGFIFFTISDLFYSYLDWQGLYGSGNLIDLGWNFGYLLIAMSGLHQNQLVKSLKLS